MFYHCTGTLYFTRQWIVHKMRLLAPEKFTPDLQICHQLLISLVMLHINCCNSVLVGLLASTMFSFQRVQHWATWLTVGLNPKSQIIPAVQQPHWQPVNSRSPSGALTALWWCQRSSEWGRGRTISNKEETVEISMHTWNFLTTITHNWQ